jgi:hypothetical protein
MDIIGRPIFFLREREREKSEIWGDDNERHYKGGGEENNCFGFEVSQAVPTSPSGRGEDCVQD